MLGKSALGRIENYIFLVNFGSARTSGASSDALQCAMKREHVGDPQLDFGFFCHGNTLRYDNAGRRNSAGGSFARTGLPNAMTQTAYNENNQLTNWKGASLTYDANGNLTGDGTNTYTWTARNQLQAISSPSPRVFSMIRSVAA